MSGRARHREAGRRLLDAGLLRLHVVSFGGRPAAVFYGYHARGQTIYYVPSRIRAAFDDGMAEGVAWKLAPLRVFPDRWGRSLDNDCILWELPSGIRAWLERADPHQCLLVEDARALYGQFADVCGPEPRNAGIRGLPPRCPLEEAFDRLLRM